MAVGHLFFHMMEKIFMTQEDILQQKETLKKYIKKRERQQNLYSNIRLLLAVIVVLALAAYFKEHIPAGMGVAIVAAGLFMIYVSKFRHNVMSIEKQQAHIDILDRYEKRMNGTWSDFADDGNEFSKEAPGISDDLDLFGSRSLFQYLSVAHTSAGRKALARLLTKPEMKDIRSRQASVVELLRDDEFVIAFEAMAYQPKERKREAERRAEEGIRNYASGETAEAFKGAQAIGVVLLLMTLTVTMAVLLKILPLVALAVVFIIQMGFSIILGGPIAEHRKNVLHFQARLEGLSERIDLIQKKSFDSILLKTIKKDLEKSPQSFKKLNTMVGLWNLRENFLFYFVLCGFLAWDFNAVAAIERWRKQYGKEFCHWLDSLGEVEALMSLGTIGRVRQDVSIAQIIDSNFPMLEMVSATHPLLNPETAIANDYEQTGKTVIITGSNMSGKSTFMRTIGLNAVLAYAGGIVSAQKFRISPMHILTSMRVRDDVGGGISTFYGEILRIKNMAEYAKTRKPMMALIDEIFKGTNSADRIIGAETAIKKLSQPWIFTMVTTHDFELCTLVENEEIKGDNYHFEEYYENDEIKFKYKIFPGRCKTTNAQQLMRMAGLLE